MTVTGLSALPPRTFADQNRRLVAITEPVDSLQGLSPTLLNGAEVIDASCRTTQANTRLSATGSETISEPAICEDAGASTFGASAYEGTLEVFRFFDDETPGAADPEGDALFQALREKGTTVVIVERHTNKKWDAEFEAGDEYSAFRVDTDNWQKPSDQHTGYVKATIPLAVQAAELNGVVAEDTSGT